MSERSSIEWTDATWQIVTGCSVVSPACTNCYAMRLAGTRLRNHPSRAGLTRETKTGPVWTGEVRFNEEWLLQPLQWKSPRRIFVAAHGDLFHEGVKDEWLDRIFAVMARTNWHTFQILTKRPQRMRRFIEAYRAKSLVEGLVIGDKITFERAFSHVWFGVTAEDQKRADERIPELLATPAALRFVSVEPMLGPVDLTRVRAPEDNDDGAWRFNALSTGDYYEMEAGKDAMTGKQFYASGDGPNRETRLDLVICGGESGPGARPMHPDWARGLRDQCEAAGVPFHFKQWGEWKPVCAMSEDEIDAAYYPAPKAFPEAFRRRRFAECVLHVDAEQFDDVAARGAFLAGKNGMLMIAVGKKRAGRLLDGVEHNGMPEVIHG